MGAYIIIYGDDIFVLQSVWSDDEYDVSINNKPCDVMGLDAPDDNIILAKFPDYNDKLFDAKK